MLQIGRKRPAGASRAACDMPLFAYTLLETWRGHEIDGFQLAALSALSARV